MGTQYPVAILSLAFIPFAVSSAVQNKGSTPVPYDAEFFYKKSGSHICSWRIFVLDRARRRR